MRVPAQQPQLAVLTGGFAITAERSDRDVIARFMLKSDYLIDGLAEGVIGPPARQRLGNRVQVNRFHIRITGDDRLSDRFQGHLRKLGVAV